MGHIAGEYNPTLTGQGKKVTTYFAVCEVIDLLTDIVDIRLWLIVCGTAGNVVVGLGQTDDGALQTNIHRVRQCGMVHLWVIV